MARREKGGRRHGGGSQGTKRTKRTQLSKAGGREGGGGCLHPSIRAGRPQGIEITTITLPRVVLGTWGGMKPRQFRRTTLCGPAGRRQKWREVLRVVLCMAGVVVVVAAVVAVVAAVVAVVVVVAVMVAAVRRSERERDRGGRSRRDRRDRRDRRESTRRDWKE